MGSSIYIEPRQPLFVTGSQEYKKYIFNKYGIVHFYSCKTGENPRFAVPDGSVDIVFCCDSIMPDCMICGTVTHLQSVLLKPYCRYFGVRFKPGFNPMLEKGDIMNQFINNQVPFEDVVSDERLLIGIWMAKEFSEQIKIFLHSYMSMYRRVFLTHDENAITEYSIHRMFETGGLLGLSLLSDEIGYTQRYINRVFKTKAGISPKQFSKIVRFQKAVEMLNYEQNSSLTDISTELGYFDQAHFVHDFKAYTDITPKLYRELLFNNDFYKKLEIVPAKE